LFPVVFAGAKLAKKLGVERLAIKVSILNYSWKKKVQTGALELLNFLILRRV
jgi:hypothetical protein